MPTPPILTDRMALARHRTRARRDPAPFLHQAVADEAQQRLIGVNRSFTAAAIVTPFAEIWQETWPAARLVPDEEMLALVPGAHDLVIHALALHWANDPVGQLVQCLRALRPDGLFLGFAFGGRTLHELRACLAEAEVALTGGLSPRVLPMAEIRDLGGLLQRAGFALPVADCLSHAVSYRDAWHLMTDLRAMGETNALAARLRHPTRRAVLADAAARYATRFGQPDGRITATFDILCLTGWAPHASQQQPLRPGSAVQRLADALGATPAGMSKPTPDD